MRITTQAWETDIRRLAKLNEKAAQLMAEYLAAHGTADTDPEFKDLTGMRNDHTDIGPDAVAEIRRRLEATP